MERALPLSNGCCDSGRAEVLSDWEWDKQDTGPDCSSTDLSPDVLLLVTVNIFEALLCFFFF